MSEPKRRYEAIATTLSAIANCKKHKNDEWLVKHHEKLRNLTDWTSLYKFDEDASTPEKLVFVCHYQHYNDVGYATKNIRYVIRVYGSLLYGIDIRIRGKNLNGVHDVLHEDMDHFLKQLVGECGDTVTEAE